jgi:hypothetical protein
LDVWCKKLDWTVQSGGMGVGEHFILNICALMALWRAQREYPINRYKSFFGMRESAIQWSFLE